MFSTYWNKAKTYEALKVYIQLNMDGLKDVAVRMLAGDSVFSAFAGRERPKSKMQSKCTPKAEPQDEFDRNGYIAFWNEWHRRRG